jgi:hypothetical protein
MPSCDQLSTTLSLFFFRKRKEVKRVKTRKRRIKKLKESSVENQIGKESRVS